MRRDAAGADAAAADLHRILHREVDVDAQFGVFVAEDRRTVALLAGEAARAADRADAFGRCGQRRERRKEVGALRGVEFERPQRPPRDGEALGFADQPGAGAFERRADGRIGLFRERREIVHFEFAGRGSGHEQHGGGAPVAFDRKRNGRVALASGDVELFVVLMVDLHAEAGRQIEGHVDVGRRDRIADAEGGVRGGERQRHQQARNELRRHGTVDEGFAAAQGAADLDRQPPPQSVMRAPSLRSGAIIVSIGRASSVPRPSMRIGAVQSDAIGVKSRAARPDSPTRSTSPRGARPPSTARMSPAVRAVRAPSVSMQRKAERVSSQNPMLRSSERPSASSEAASARWA